MHHAIDWETAKEEAAHPHPAHGLEPYTAARFISDALLRSALPRPGSIPVNLPGKALQAFDQAFDDPFRFLGP